MKEELIDPLLSASATVGAFNHEDRSPVNGDADEPEVDQGTAAELAEIDIPNGRQPDQWLEAGLVVADPFILMKVCRSSPPSLRPIAYPRVLERYWFDIK